MEHEEVRQALEQGGSIRAAAKLLGKSYNALQWWIARQGFRVEYRAILVPAQFELTEKGNKKVNAHTTENTSGAISTPKTRQMVETE